MKPPVRRRVAPLRLDIDPKFFRYKPCSVWTRREKIYLLSALTAQGRRKELDINLLKQKLPRKKEDEIINFIAILKGRVARESVRKEYKRYRAERCWEGEDILAPIEVWTELAEKVSGKLDEVLTAAFTQILTIAATEPVSLLHSIPSKKKKIPKLFLDSVSPSCKSPLSSPSHTSTELISPETRAQSEQDSACSLSPENENIKPNVEETIVDFENIYKYLFALARGSPCPALTSFESAVILDLLLSLPKELNRLDSETIKSHMYRSFKNLNMPCRTSLETQDSDAQERPGQAKSTDRLPRNTKEESKGALSGESSASSEDEKNSSSDDPTWQDPSIGCASTQTSVKSMVKLKQEPVLDSQPRWKDLSICPLNPFMVPLKLMCRVDN